MFILGLGPRINSFSSRFFGVSQRELSGVLRTATVFLFFLLLFLSPLLCEISVVIYPSPPFILAVYLLIM